MRCRALLKEDEEEFKSALSKADAEQESQLALELHGRWERFKLWLPTNRYWELPDNVRYRFPYTAGVLSFVPGLGQVYNQQWQKGILLAAVWWAYAFICVLTIKQSFSNFLLFGLLLSWLYVWNDAVASAIRINGESWSVRNSIALWFGIVSIAGASIMLLQFFGMNLILFVQVFKPVHAPLIKKGDFVFVNCMSYWFSKPRLGDVIYFDPPRFTAERGADVYSINIQDYFQRVAGVGGDHVKIADGKFTRNGVSLPMEFTPAGAEVLPRWELDVPPDHFFAPITGIPSDITTGLSGGTLPSLFQSGFVFKDWDKASTVSKKEIYGRGVAIINPPERRRWFN